MHIWGHQARIWATMRRLFDRVGRRVDVGAPQLSANRCGPLKMYSGK
jgi:hypothetical protein